MTTAVSPSLGRSMSDLSVRSDYSTPALSYGAPTPGNQSQPPTPSQFSSQPGSVKSPFESAFSAFSGVTGSSAASSGKFSPRDTASGLGSPSTASRLSVGTAGSRETKPLTTDEIALFDLHYQQDHMSERIYSTAQSKADQYLIDAGLDDYTSAANQDNKRGDNLGLNRKYW